MQIYVDADACPVKDEAVKVAERHKLACHFVSNSFMRLPTSLMVRRQIVAEGADAADNWIVDQIAPGDIAVTADIPLASRCLKKGARVIGMTGKPFTDATIGMALAMRGLMQDLREAGAVKGNNPEFTRADRSRFLQALEQAVQDARKGT
jgi:uncharacterized protein